MAETPLVSYLRLQRATDRQVLSALRAADESVRAELKRLQSKTGVGGAMRREQLLRSQAAINREMTTLWARVGEATESARAEAAAAGAETVLRESKSVLRSVLEPEDYDYMLRSAQESARRSVEVLSERVSGSSYIPLAQSVYDNAALSTGKIDDIVNSAIARGASAAELARDVRAYVNPNTPGGVRYASMRLARTELNNAFHAAQIREAQEEPWTVGVKWHLSGSHPRPDECNDYADDVHFTGGETGVWKPEEVPGKPHPNCLCYTTPVTLDEDEFLDAFINGDLDDHLEERGFDVESEVGSTSAFRGMGRPEQEFGIQRPEIEFGGSRASMTQLQRTDWIARNYTPLEQEAMTKYASGQTFFDMKKAYLDGKPFRGDGGEDLFPHLESAMTKAKTAVPTTLTRSMKVPKGWSDNLVEGAEIDHQFYISTTTATQEARSYGARGRRGENVVLNILAPEGTPVMPGMVEISELVLRPDSRMRVRRVFRGDSRTIVTVDLA